jgi:hypothetical protein
VTLIRLARHNASDTKLQGDWSFGVKQELLDETRDMLRNARSSSFESCVDPADEVRSTAAHAARMPWRPSENLGAVVSDESPPQSSRTPFTLGEPAAVLARLCSASPAAMSMLSVWFGEGMPAKARRHT